MDSFVKNLFLTLMGALVALFLFWLFFGVKQTDTWWKGALWIATESVEVGISKYYYEYCYLPTIHSSDGVDKSINGKFRGDTYNTATGVRPSYNCVGNGSNMGVLKQTGTDLGADDVTQGNHSYNTEGSVTDYIKFQTGNGLVAYWSTGWK